MGCTTNAMRGPIVLPTPRHRVVLCFSSKSRRYKAKRPGLFEVQVVTPPKESLGVHSFHPDTHNGDHIHVQGKDWVVSSLVLKYKLVRGKYEREHNRLNVQEMSRYFLNMHLDTLLDKPAPLR